MWNSPSVQEFLNRKPAPAGAGRARTKRGDSSQTATLAHSGLLVTKADITLDKFSSGIVMVRGAILLPTGVISY